MSAPAPDEALSQDLVELIEAGFEADRPSADIAIAIIYGPIAKHIAALQADVARLKAENGVLSKRLEAREESIRLFAEAERQADAIRRAEDECLRKHPICIGTDRHDT